jgi:hypothetical protein
MRRAFLGGEGAVDRGMRHLGRQLSVESLRSHRTTMTILLENSTMLFLSTERLMKYNPILGHHRRSDTYSDTESLEPFVLIIYPPTLASCEGALPCPFSIRNGKSGVELKGRSMIHVINVFLGDSEHSRTAPIA